MKQIFDVLEKQNLTVGVFGLGKSNEGAIWYLKEKYPSAKFILRSDSSLDSCPTYADSVFTGKDALKDIKEDILFLSPSVRRDRYELVEAQRRGVLLFSDAELFFTFTKSSPICITGSDGKSTTTKLIATAYSLSGFPAVPCGNFGKSLSSLITDNVLPIAELSSFQLSYLTPHSSHAIITNITPNHLNWHASLEEYISAKMNIIKNAEKIIFDCDSAILNERLNDRSVYAKTSLTKSYASLKAIGGGENYVTLDKEIIYVNGSASIDVSEAKRKEPYNLRNYLLTVSACMDRCNENAIRKALISFGGLPHRAEVFAEHNGIKYIDSSIDSSPERTIKTLSALSGKVIVIIGGKGKGLALEPLADVLPKLTEGAVLVGEVGYELSKILESRKTGYSFTLARELHGATLKAMESASRNFTIILSPAATSFDAYKNFEERGNDFKNIVLSLIK